MIIPKEYLKTIKRTGLGFAAFAELRYHNPVEVAKLGPEIAREIDSFVLNKPHYRHSSFLIAGQNFGCGSSREHAPWSILGMGIRCIIAPSFADIFYNNCFKNGMLPVVLPEAQVSHVDDPRPVFSFSVRSPHPAPPLPQIDPLLQERDAAGGSAGGAGGPSACCQAPSAAPSHARPTPFLTHTHSTLCFKNRLLLVVLLESHASPLYTRAARPTPPLSDHMST
jgi:hypothetical protein